jgi:hypothetical protein
MKCPDSTALVALRHAAVKKCVGLRTRIWAQAMSA